jgi:hypothetical protein
VRERHRGHLFGSRRKLWQELTSDLDPCLQLISAPYGQVLAPNWSSVAPIVSYVTPLRIPCRTSEAPPLLGGKHSLHSLPLRSLILSLLAFNASWSATIFSRSASILFGYAFVSVSSPFLLVSIFSVQSISVVWRYNISTVVSDPTIIPNQFVTR